MTVVSIRRYFALARAEIILFFRNKTLLVMAIICPIVLPFAVMYSLPKTGAAAVIAGLAMEIFLLMALMFVQFYSVLSVMATRRDEKVLKRLRTGEVRDSEILLAIATPGALLTLGLTIVVVALLSVISKQLPTMGLGIVWAMVFGIIIATACALLSSAITANAESVQVTAMPVMILAMLSQSSIRLAFPQHIQEIVDRTPFALLVDLSNYDWTGANTLKESVPTMGYLLLWALALCWLAARHLRWETNR